MGASSRTVAHLHSRANQLSSSPSPIYAFLFCVTPRSKRKGKDKKAAKGATKVLETPDEEEVDFPSAVAVSTVMDLPEVSSLLLTESVQSMA